MTNVLLDTHVVLWWISDPTKLSSNAADAIRQADEVFMSPISAWEIGMLVEKKRILLDRPLNQWIYDALARPKVRTNDVSWDTAAHAAQLSDLHGDPIDRMMVAIALTEKMTLVTKDQKILKFGKGFPGLDAVW